MSLIATVIVVVYLIIFFAFGWKKGFFRMILTTLSLVVTLIISAFLLNPVTNWVIENTSIQESVEKSVSNALGWGEDSDSSSSSEKTTTKASSDSDKKEEESTSEKKSFWDQIKEAAEELSSEIGLPPSATSESSTISDSNSQAKDAPETVAGWEENETSLNNAMEAGVSVTSGEAANLNEAKVSENETELLKAEEETTVDYSQYIEQLEASGVDVSQYANGDYSDWSDVEEALGENSEALTEIENDAIDELSLPTFLKNMLTKNNNAAEYVKLGVSNFKQYIVRTISNLIIKILVYIALVIAILIIIRILLMITKMISRIPIIHGFNKFFGGLLGLLQGLIYLWLFCLLISVFSETSFGMGLMDVINGSALLQLIYEGNLISALANSIVSVF